MDFSFYDQYLSKFDEGSDSQAVTSQSKTEPVAENPEIPTAESSPLTVEAQPEIKTEESTENPYKVVLPEDIDFMSEDSPASRMSKHDNDEQDGATKKSKSVSKLDVLMMAGTMDGLSDMVNVWTEQLVDIREHSEVRIPKGIRISIHRLKEIEDILRATKTVLETLPLMDFAKALQTMEQNKLLSICKLTSKNIKEGDEKLVTVINELKEAINSANPDVRTKAREMKQMVLSIHSDVEKLGHSFVNTLFDYPDEYDELAVFSVIAEKGEDTTHIDRAFMVLGERAIHVVDAPAMIKAMKEKDNKTMTAILERMMEDWVN